MQVDYGGGTHALKRACVTPAGNSLDYTKMGKLRRAIFYALQFAQRTIKIIAMNVFLHNFKLSLYTAVGDVY